MIDFSINITQACKVLHLSKSSYYYEKRIKDDSEIIDAINKLVDKHPRNGFWLLFNRLRKLGFAWNHKRVYRVYKAMGLNFKKRCKKRIPKRIKQPLQDLFEPNEQWSMDFMSDSLYSGRRYRILNIMDEFNRELIEFEVGTSLPAVKVIQALQRAIDFRGKPKSIRVDNGPEFISHKLEMWCYIHNIELKFIQPGCPTQNSRVERFNGSMRREFFLKESDYFVTALLHKNAYLFYTLDEVKTMVKEWIDDYNNHRPHAVLGKLSPIEYLNKYNLNMSYSV